MELLYWHWLIAGMILMAGEIFIPSFTIFWFGLAALLVGVLQYAGWDASLKWQLVTWALASTVFTVLWFKVLRPRWRDQQVAAAPAEKLLGEVGIVLRSPTEAAQGVVRFSVPVLGADEWDFRCTESVHPGDKVRVVDIDGNTLQCSLAERSESTGETA